MQKRQGKCSHDLVMQSRQGTYSHDLHGPYLSKDKFKGKKEEKTNSNDSETIMMVG